MKRKIVEVIVVILCLIFIALAAAVFAKMTGEDKAAMENIVKNRW